MMMHSSDGHGESKTARVLSNESANLQKGFSAQTDFSVDAPAVTNTDDSNNSGWFEVKKKSRSTKSSACNKSFSSSHKTVEVSGKFKSCSDQQARDGSRLCLGVVEQPENLATLHEQVAPKPRDSDASFQCKDAVGCSLTTTGNFNKSSISLSDEKMMNTNALSNMVDTLKFRWGNLDDEDLTQNEAVQGNTESGVTDSSVMHDDEDIVKNDNSTICLEGGKQSSTKQVNGMKNEDIRKVSAESSCISHLNSICSVSESINASEGSNTTVSNEQQNTTGPADGEDLAKDLAFPTTKHSSHAIGDDVDQSADIVESSKQSDAKELITSSHGTSPMQLYPAVTECTTGHEKIMDYATTRGATEYYQYHQDNDHDGAGPKPSVKFSVAASMLIGNFEENQSIESKERFRQRLWCYLFENLNRAIDELYFLCELECDMEQIQEALLVLKEAGLDFNELKSRVEGFEKVKKHSSTSHSPFGGKLEGPFCGKVEHRRPHAIAWEVRRMACSPHRAEILSSSLEAFRKVQQITADKNLVSQSKRREAAQLLIKQSCAEMPKMPSFVDSNADMNENVAEVCNNPGSFMKDSKLLISDVRNVTKQHKKEIYAADSNVDVIGEACSKSASKGNSGIYDKDGFVIDRACVSSTRTGKESITTNTERQSKSVEKRVSIVDNQREKKNTKVRSSMDAWKVKRNWEDVLSSPLKSLNRASRSPSTGWRSAERVKVLHDKLMSPERKRKSPLEMKKEVDEKQARATRIRRELENERVQRLQKTTEKLNRVSEWQAVRSNKLREGMHARQQRGESRHEAHLAEIARRAGDESSKVSEVRFITSLNEENKKLSLKQKLQDSELRRAERLQSIKIKQKEDVAREEAVLERRRIIEAERLQRLAEAQRRKEEAKARRDEERKAASAAREARAVEQVRKKEVRAKAQQEVTELQAQKLIEKLRESEFRRKVYLEQIRERATMESREQASPSTRLSVSRDGQARNINNQTVIEGESSHDKEAKQNKGTPSALQHHALKKRMKKIRQRLMSKKYEFLEPPSGTEGSGIGTIAVAAAARSKVGRWLQDLQKCQLAKKTGASGVGFIVAEMVKYFDGKVAELHAARQAGLLDFIATALPASHTSKAEASQTTISLLRILKVLLALPANRSYFISRNLLPPLIPMLSRALENFSSQDWVSATVGITNLGSSTVTDKASTEEKPDAIGEVLNGLLECVMLIMNHNNTDERQVSMKEDLVDLLVACEVIHHLRDMFSLFDRPQVEGAAFPVPVLFGLHLLQALTAMRIKVGLPYHLQLSAMIERQHVSGGISKGEIKETLDSSDACDQNTHTKEGDTDESNAGKLAVNGDHAENGSVLRSDDVVVAMATDIFVKEVENVPISGSAISPVYEIDNEKAHIRQKKWPAGSSINFLVSAIADTGLVGLPSLLTAVLLQTNPRSTPEQAAAALPSNFNEVATCVLKVLNNLARLDLGLVQNLLAMPDLQMEFFHLVSFLLTHCTCKWSNLTDQVASLLFETLILLGYFALMHPGNQAVLRWGKSPTILHKICDLPFAFFSDPSLIPVLVGTVLAVCYGSEQNRDVIKEEISMDMLLSLLKASRTEVLVDRDLSSEEVMTFNAGDQASVMDVCTNDEKTECRAVLEEDSIPAKEEIKRIIETSIVSEGDPSYNNNNLRLQAASKMGGGRSSSADHNPSPGRKGPKIAPPKSNAAVEGDPIFGKETRSSMNKNQTKGSTSTSSSSVSTEIATHLMRKGKFSITEPSSATKASNSNPSSVVSMNQQPTPASENLHPNLLDGMAPSLTDAPEPCLYLRADLLLQNRFPDCLLDKAEAFFAAVL